MTKILDAESAAAQITAALQPVVTCNAAENIKQPEPPKAKPLSGPGARLGTYKA